MKGMGQYKLQLRAKLDIVQKESIREELAITIREILEKQSVIYIDELREKLRLPTTITDEEIISIASKIKPEAIIVKEEYHWYDEHPTAKHKINTKTLKEILKEKAREYGLNKIEDYAAKILHLPRKTIEKYLEWFKTDKKKLEIKALKKFCNTFNINYKKLEEHNVFLDYKFPVNLRSPTIIKLKTHILNEGTLRARKGHYEARYANQDPLLHTYVRQLLKELGKEPRTPPLSSKEAMITYINGTTARILHAAGIPPGPKTKTNPPLDPKIFKNPELRKYHIQTTLTEEGSSYLRAYKGRLLMTISWSRSVDVTDELTDDEKSYLKALVKREGKRKIPIGKVERQNVLNSILRLKPRLLIDELRLLQEAHKDVERRVWSIPRPKSVHISKDDRITVAWQVVLTNPKVIEILYNHYGMLKGTWKAQRFERLYGIYKKYKGKRITSDVINSINELKRERPAK
ncbi:MAG: hypothetical protein DRN61_00865, partial [Thaumarchaeota archaeon]